MHQISNNIDVVLLDIEGTICSISFVKDVLFPYALEGLPNVLQHKWDDPTFQPYKDAFPSEYRTSPEIFRGHVEDLTKRDVKIAYLKNLQGYLWQSGYESKAYATPLFPDVVTHLKQWKSSSKELVIYSSGSVFAQKLLFTHVKTDTAENPDPRNVTSTEGLTDLITEWFDTVNAGLKTESSSYRAIATQLNKPAQDILFLSDNVKEIKAALEAGMSAVVVDRPGNLPLSDKDYQQYQVIKSFDELGF